MLHLFNVVEMQPDVMNLLAFILLNYLSEESKSSCENSFSLQHFEQVHLLDYALIKGISQSPCRNVMHVEAQREHQKNERI